jgi:hypothetical protein
MSDTQKLEQAADSGLPSHDLLCSSIPSRLPDGRQNPEWRRDYARRRKEAGNPLKQYPKSAEYWANWRKTPTGMAAVKRWNESEAGKAAMAKYRASKKGQRKRHETGEEYADRIIRELEAISRHNKQKPRLDVVSHSTPQAPVMREGLAGTTGGN